MSFRYNLQTAIYNTITQDVTLLGLSPAAEVRADVKVPPNLQFPYIVFGVKRRKSANNGDNFTLNGKLYIDLWTRREPTEDESFAYEVCERLMKLFNKKTYTDPNDASASCRFFYCDDYETPVLIDGNLVEPELRRDTVEFDCRIIDPALVDAIIDGA